MPSPRPTSARNERERRNEKIERKKVERGRGAIVVGMKNERETRDKRESKKNVMPLL